LPLNSETEMHTAPVLHRIIQKSRLLVGPLSGRRLERSDVILKVSNLKHKKDAKLETPVPLTTIRHMRLKCQNLSEKLSKKNLFLIILNRKNCKVHKAHKNPCQSSLSQYGILIYITNILVCKNALNIASWSSHIQYGY
jgi:hypothetical protein